MVKQYPIKIATTFSETTKAGLAAKYLNSDSIKLRDGVELAITCLFAPLGAAIDGASRAQVEELIVESRTQMETYFSIALNRCFQNFSTNIPEASQYMLEESSVQPLVSTDDNSVLELDSEENIDLDNEEI